MESEWGSTGSVAPSGEIGMNAETQRPEGCLDGSSVRAFLLGNTLHAADESAVSHYPEYGVRLTRTDALYVSAWTVADSGELTVESIRRGKRTQYWIRPNFGADTSIPTSVTLFRCEDGGEELELQYKVGNHFGIDGVGAQPVAYA